ncbi:hypothetical protein GCM10027082_07850 [Comamonas humi]
MLNPAFLRLALFLANGGAALVQLGWACRMLVWSEASAPDDRLLAAILFVAGLLQGGLGWAWWRSCKHRAGNDRSREKHELITRERQRIARQLHDGVGGPLVLAVAESRHLGVPALVLVQHLEACLFNLRTSVDAMAMENPDLMGCLVQLRHRIDPLLRSRRITLIWQISASTPPPMLDSEAVGHFHLIVQEALCNVLQHAQARKVSIRSYAIGQKWVLEIENDGVRFPTNGAELQGRGLAGMRHRAKCIRARLRLMPLPRGGLLLRLEIPQGASPEPLSRTWGAKLTRK